MQSKFQIYEDLIKFVDSFKGKKIGVIGDLILDRYIWGDTERISPEAPVPIVLVEKETFVPGGTGNVAMNIQALGGSAFVVGVVGEDEAGRQLLDSFRKNTINIDGIFKIPKRITTEKIRIISRHQQMVRIDKEIISAIENSVEKKIIRLLSDHIKDWDGIIISDYTKGVITQNLVNKIKSLAKKYNVLVVGDAKPKHASFFKHVDLFKINHQEAMETAKTDDIKKAGRIIQQWSGGDVLITRGSEGMTIFKGKAIKHLPTQAKEVLDITGAGDTVIASVTLALIAGASLEKSAIIANHAAGIAVGKIGAATVSPEELKDSLKNDK